MQNSTTGNSSRSDVFGSSLSPDATYAERQAYRLDVLKLPGPIDRWLTVNSHCPRITCLQDYLLLTDINREYVDCFVESICVETAINCAGLIQPPTYSLYISARVPSSTPTLLFLRKSPRALLERFTGFNNALDAPEWTRWDKPTLEFQQPKATFAAIFIRMAGWNENKDEPGLPYIMAQWARSVMFPSEVTVRKFRPVTPHKPQLVTNMNPPKKQVSSYSGDHESPTKFRRVSPVTVSRLAVTIKVEDARTAESANLSGLVPQ